MERYELIDARLETKVVCSEKIATFAPSAAAMGQLCLALTLLEWDLVSSVVFEGNGRHFLIVSVDGAIPPSVGALAQWEPPRIRLRLSTNSLERWLAFALKYYRDGVGHVEHIDIEARSSPGEDADMVLVFKVPSATEELLPEQAKALINSFEK
jgi:hypothetical protein